MNIWKEIIGWTVAILAVIVIIPLAPFVACWAEHGRRTENE